MDILITVRPNMNAAYVHYETPKGAAWIDNNMIARTDSKAAVRIAIDTADEVADKMRSDGLVVEVR